MNAKNTEENSNENCVDDCETFDQRYLQQSTVSNGFETVALNKRSKKKESWEYIVAFGVREDESLCEAACEGSLRGDNAF